MDEFVFRRKIYDRMLQWKQESKGETALLVEGPRRVGKSTVVGLFAENEYKTRVIIDFSKASDAEKALFDDLSDMDFFFSRLKVLKGVDLYERQSVIVFDEVQKFPEARQAIKALVEDGRYDYIETGSLISIHQNVENIIIPSEEESVNMYPMDYEEFRWALGDTVSIGLMREALAKGKGFGDDVNRRLMRDFRLYMLVGGMPQAVSKYIETKDFAKVDAVKRSIVRLYRDDFRKFDRTGKAQDMFMAIPAELYKNANRYQTTTVIEKTRAETVSELIYLMQDSKTVNVAYHANDPNVGLGLTADKSAYKMYICDTGLFVTMDLGQVVFRKYHIQ